MVLFKGVLKKVREKIEIVFSEYTTSKTLATGNKSKDTRLQKERFSRYLFLKPDQKLFPKTYKLVSRPFTEKIFVFKNTFLKKRIHRLHTLRQLKKHPKL